jgi:ADP-dependent NAD(P)H-hydrate dehydratase / NAD(P)H-hydrate epimerase
MKIYSASVIKELDKYTIEKSGISSIDLMESAAEVFTNYFSKKFGKKNNVKIFCGTGNNGGDGLAVSRLLLQKKYTVQTYILLIGKNYAPDFRENLARLENIKETNITYLNEDAPIHFSKQDVIVDAIFGSGLSGPVKGFTEKIIEQINKSNCPIVAIDIPSGLSCDYPIDGTKIKADYTLSFELPKLAFFMPENSEFVGKWRVKSIGLNEEFIEETPTNYFYFTHGLAKKIIRYRSKFSHKGSNGHALIVAGQSGFFGAAILSAKACVVSGSGLTTIHTPEKGMAILHTALPEAIVHSDDHQDIITGIDLPPKINTLAIGPGMGTDKKTLEAFKNMLKEVKFPLVIDADAINLLSKNKELLNLLPPLSILTPHPKEFERLVGNWKNDFERLEKQINFSTQHKVIIVLKGAHTSISTPNGKVFFNSSGNPALATGGSGDVLTGIITALLAQQYTAENAALLGVYLHGLSADICQADCHSERMTASQIIEYLPFAFEQVLK